MNSHVGLMLAVLVALQCACTHRANETPSQIVKLEELTYTDIDRLDRSKSIFFLTFGNLEEHGPHIPVGSDYFVAIGIRDELIERLRSAHADYRFVLVPVVPLGECGANDMAGQFDHIGTFGVRFETLRNVAIDLGASIARKGFRNVFLMHDHGCPLHNTALNEAAAFVTEKYKVGMVNITSLFIAAEDFNQSDSRVMEKHLGKNWEQTVGFDNSHAGAAETSENLFVRGDLVRPIYKDLPVFFAKDPEAFYRTYERAGWQGYWGAPG